MAGRGSDMRATYVPGRDDYYAQPPQNNLVSPAPQRVNPGMPNQIQTNLAQLDLNNSEAQAQGFRPGPQSPQSAYTPSVYTVSSAGSAPTPQPRPASQSQSSNQQEPNFSGIPRLPFRTDNVPESADERGERLERDRVPILGSSNFEDQIGWATDALNYVDVSAEQDRRLSPIQRPRPSTPPAERQLKQDALGIVNHMANQSHPRALFLQGMWYEFGKFGFPEDKRQAFNCFSKSAQLNYPRAEYRMGMQFEATGNPGTALQHFRTGEAAGDSACCYRMGMVYALGQLGQPQDQQHAIQLIRHAADTADDNAPQGAYVYGMLQAKDLPQLDVPDHLLPQNLDSARYYIEKSALLGFCKAQLKMGSAYEVASLHCEFNPLLSIHYNALAARQGEPEAEMALSKWFMIGHEGVCSISHELSYKYAQRAALSGLPAAEFAMGYFHEIGWFVNKDIENARAWYDKAAKDGSKEAGDGLRRLNSTGALSMQDHNNIAVSRIKSVHGSQRGNRPPRLKQRAAQQLPPIQDEYGRATPPPRTTSAAPYPTDDSGQAHAAAYASSQVSMPGNVPPPNSSHGSPPPPNGGYGPALGQRPVPAPSPLGTHAGMGSPVPPRPEYSSPGPGGPYGHGPPPPLRQPQSAMDMSSGRHYGNQAPSRMSSMPNVAGTGTPPPQGGAYPPRPPKEPMHPGLPPQGQARPNVQPPYAPQPQRPGQAGRPSPAPGSRPSFDNRPSQPPMTGTPGPSAPGMLRPQSNQATGARPPSRPGSSHSAAPSRAQGRTPPPSNHPGPSSPAPGQKTGANRPPMQSRPSGTGPKTFEQMGLPPAKSEGECVMMQTKPDPQNANDADPAELEKQATALQTETVQLQTTLKNLKTQLSSLISTSMPTTELHAAIGNLVSDHEQLETRLYQLKKSHGNDEGPLNAMTKEEELLLKKRETYWRRRVETRAKIRTEMWKTLVEALEQMEDIDIETVKERLGLDV
ncbi:MAG: hypothetical protein Q9162_002091 [Coniocarpon cinnabarinum]